MLSARRARISAHLVLFLAGLSLTALRAAGVACQNYEGGLRWIASLPMGTNGDTDIALHPSESIAYVAMGRIVVADIADPAHPAELGVVSEGYNNPRGVDTDGSLLVAAIFSTGVEIYSLVDPTDPQLVTRYVTPTQAVDVALHGDVCYVGCVDLGVLILDIADPAQPVPLGSVGYDDCEHLAVANGALYAACKVPNSSQRFELLVYDLADPSSPAETFRWGDDVRNAVPADGRLIAALGLEGFAVFDLAVPSSPALLGILDTASFVGGAAAANGHVYPIYSSQSVVECYLVAGTPPWSLLDTLPTAFGPEVIEFRGGHAFCATGQGLEVYDLAQPEGGAELLGYLESNTAFIRAIAARNGYAYVTDDGDIIGQRYLRVLDVQDPAQPALIHTVSYFNGVPADLAVADTLLYVADYLGVDVVNISKPPFAFRTGHFDTPGDAQRLVLAGDLLFVADGAEGLRIASIAGDPTQPVLVGKLQLPNDSVDLDLLDAHVVVLSNNGELSVVDVDPPGSAHVIGELLGIAPGSGAIAVQGSVAYVDGETEVVVVDLSTPSAPTILATLPVAGFVRDLDARGGVLYVASHTSGLQAVDITDPAQPRLIGGLAMLSLSNRVLAQDELVYVASDLRLNVAPLDCLSLTAVPGDAAPAAVLRLTAQPNPFNPFTRVHYTLAAPAAVTLSIYDAMGRHLRTLLAGVPRAAGPHALDWDGRDSAGRPLASGVYVLRLAAGASRATGKVTLLR